MDVHKGAQSCLFHRARNIPQGENIQVEEDHLRGVLEGNGYPEAFVKMASRPHTVREPAEEPRATAFISYVGGLIEDVRRVCRRYKHLNSILIGIHPPRTTDKSQGSGPAGEEVGGCVPDTLQL